MHFHLLFLLALSCYIAALCIEYPDIVPGPGLPSLQSLNLTTADIHELSKAEISTGKARTAAKSHLWGI